MSKAKLYRTLKLCVARLSEYPDATGGIALQLGQQTIAEYERAIESDPVVVEFDTNDRSELYHIIQNRGNCSTRNKLIDALRKLDPDLLNTLKL